MRAVFGANEWLVDELYEQYLKDKNAVDPAWWDFFEGYRPHDQSPPDGGSEPVTATLPHQNGAGPTTPAPAAPAASPTAAPGVPQQTTPAAPGDAPETGDEPTPTATSPIATAQPATAPYAQVAQRTSQPDTSDATDDVQRLRGPAARVVTNMESSLEVPTATSVRVVPAKLMVDNRIVVNNHLHRGRGGKISFTHLIGFALVEALKDMPAMNAAYTLVDGKPGITQPAHVNLGLAIDLAKPDGTRQLLVPSIKRAETLDFAQFWNAYEDVVRRARGGKLTVEDFAGTTISLTNPGTIGTVHSVPRLMQGQGAIIGVGAMEYPAEFQGTSDDRLNELGVSRVLTITSTYDHRIIQGA